MNIRKLNKFFTNLFLKFNIVTSKTVDINKLKLLINLLKPIKTNHKLIRIGGKNDGGYLIPDDLENIDCLFSPGVSDVASFEQDLIKRIKGLRCFLADFSVQNSPIKHKSINFEKKFLGSISNEKFFTLKDWITKKTKSKNDLILQMDIEGFEYEVLINTEEKLLNRFRIIVIEFHNLEKLTEEFAFKFISAAFEKILKTHMVVHIHPNNTVKHLCRKYKGLELPSVMEFTFLRKDRIKTFTKIERFPHILDRPCTKKRADFILPDVWHH